MGTTLDGYLNSIRKSFWFNTSNRQFLNRGPSSKSIARLRDCMGAAPKRMTLSRCAAALRGSVPLAKRTNDVMCCWTLSQRQEWRSEGETSGRPPIEVRREKARSPTGDQPIGDVRSRSVASHGVQRPLQSGPEQEDRERERGGGEQKQDAGQRAAGRAGHRHAGVRQVQVSRPLSQLWIPKGLLEIGYVLGGSTLGGINRS